MQEPLTIVCVHGRICGPDPRLVHGRLRMHPCQAWPGSNVHQMVKHSFPDTSFVPNKPANIDAIYRVKLAGGINGHDITQSGRGTAANIQRYTGFLGIVRECKCGLGTFDIVIKIKIRNSDLDACLENRLRGLGIRSRTQDNQSGTADEIDEGGFVK